MAILQDCPGLKVQITVNDQPLKEYDDSVGPKMVTKYVEAISGSAFEVKYRFLPTFDSRYGIHVSVRLDGNKVYSTIVERTEVRKCKYHRCKGANSFINGKECISKFFFTPLIIEEDSGRKLDKALDEQLRKTGTITVMFHRIKNIRSARRRSRSIRSKEVKVSNFGSVPEKAVQAMGHSHHGSFGNAERYERIQICDIDYVDGMEDRHALATFNFKYRALATLKALCIIPRTPEPSQPPPPPYSRVAIATQAPGATGQDGLNTAEILCMIRVYRGTTTDLEGLSKTELLALLELHRGKQADNTAVKRERSDGAMMLESRKGQKEIIVLDD